MKSIYDVAQYVRKHVRGFAKRHERRHDKNFCGVCAIASTVLLHYFQQEGYDSEVCYNQYHVFNRVDDLYIDLTARQFGDYPKIYLFGPSKLEGYWVIDRTFKNKFNFIDFLEKEGWPRSQICPRVFDLSEKTICRPSLVGC